MALDSKQKKVAIAVAALLIGGGVLAWGLSSFFSSGEAPPVDPAVEQRLTEMQNEAEKAKPPSQQNQPTPMGAGQQSPMLQRPGAN